MSNREVEVFANLLPAVYEGRWIRLRPIARADYPQLFAQRIALRQVRLHILGIGVPTFDHWEATELADILRSGPAMVVEDRQGIFLGLIRLYRLELRDKRSYIEFRLTDMAIGSLMEAYLAFLDYTFNFLNLRKLYAEVLSIDETLLDQLIIAGFTEEVRLVDYFMYGGKYVDLCYLALTRSTWESVRDRIAATADISYAAEQLYTR